MSDWGMCFEMSAKVKGRGSAPNVWADDDMAWKFSHVRLSKIEINFSLGLLCVNPNLELVQAFSHFAFAFFFADLSKHQVEISTTCCLAAFCGKSQKEARLNSGDASKGFRVARLPGCQTRNQ